MPNVLISVNHDTGIAELAKGLVDEGYILYAAHENAKFLERAGIPACDVSYAYSAVSNRNPIMGWNTFKYLPEIHLGLMAQDTPENRKELVSRAVKWFDILVADVNYATLEEICDEKSTIQSVTKNIDTGNRLLLLSAAAGDRIIVTNVSMGCLQWLKDGKKDEVRKRLAMRAVAEDDCARYGLYISEYILKHLPPLE